MAFGSNLSAGLITAFFLFATAVLSADGKSVDGGTAIKLGAAPSVQSNTTTVTCQLRGQVRRIGGNFTTLAPGPRVRTSALHCAQKGGRVVSESAH